ncbi:DEAD/DEAH box helicase [Muricoccus pecuniae]|uniref:Transcription-repair-coupling factor n=1 Tax=Muricoccus pecuniae TaxID=693023 RepID=A0A840XYL5_9PROT|nr:DEAD/DEAH box helicase [Roseomonas pecuniae]MBB5692986.1 transcription-repair coupling factor (superfamily II helicase) [Roseomonas pecuniae]
MPELVAEPEGLLAARLVELAASGGAIHVARSEARAARLARAARALAPELMVERVPGWDCLPYDRTSPSRQIMGQRMGALHRLAAEGRGPCLVLASLDAATQRLPPPSAWAALDLRPGGEVEEASLRRWLERLGYVLDDRVDEPGEAALHGSVLDVFPAEEGALPCRVEHEEGRITSIRRYDPLSQRSLEEVEGVTLGPVSEVVLPEEAERAHAQGIEHGLGNFYPGLVSLFDLLPGLPVVLDPEVEELRPQRWAEVTDAWRARYALASPEAEILPATEPVALVLDEGAWKAALAGRDVTALPEPPEEPEGVLPRFVNEREPEEAFLEFLEEGIEAGRRIALSGRARQRTRSAVGLVKERLGLEPLRLAGWAELRASPPGSFAVLEEALEAGFATEEAVVVAPDDLRPPSARPQSSERERMLALAGASLGPGDAVIHLEHGLGALRGVEAVTVGEATLDCLRIEYAGGATQLVPLDEMDRLWRYGAEAEGVSLDRLGGDAWPKRRAEVEAQIAESASALAAMAAERATRTAPVLRARGGAYERFVARFPFALTADQAEGIEAVLADMASGRPMNRLVCGDVGFGKTEVALRAAAVAALSGVQVAVLAPTTVLVRQHLTTFRKRFAGIRVGGKPVRIEQLSRLSSPAEAREVKAGLADGSIRIVIGTQALAAKGVSFADLGLVVIDEEQRFGTKQKEKVRGLGAEAHVLAMTATPIPRTLQSALVGLEELSVIATPPGRRQPIRTVHVPLDDVVLRQSLAREKRRGGQSFVVCARIEDLPAMRERIEALLPGLEIIEAHGEMPPAEVDTALVRSAEGEGDVLLSTNIVETGLDVPRANTMLVWRADRFGLGQLHQLRGRVGRGRVRGTIILMTDPAEPPSALTLKRLGALEAFDRVGAGFAISARDMDLRGAGDLLGESQAGHMKLIGLDLYQHILDRALRAARGEPVPEEWTPVLAIGVSAHIPADYVEEEGVRVELHARLAEIIRRGDGAALGEFAEEVADRFGPPPEPVANLFLLARLRVRCRRLGITKLEVGPSAAAASFIREPPAVEPPLEVRGARVVLPRASAGPAELLATAAALLSRLSPRRRKRAGEGKGEQRSASGCRAANTPRREAELPA